MFDWNGNGKIDGEDFFIEHEIMNDDTGYSPGKSGGSEKKARNVWIFFIVLIVVAFINSALGLLLGLAFFAYLILA